jgi:hypothetical protein
MDRSLRKQGGPDRRSLCFSETKTDSLHPNKRSPCIGRSIKCQGTFMIGGRRINKPPSASVFSSNDSSTGCSGVQTRADSTLLKSHGCDICRSFLRCAVGAASPTPAHRAAAGPRGSGSGGTSQIARSRPKHEAITSSFDPRGHYPGWQHRRARHGRSDGDDRIKSQSCVPGASELHTKSPASRP